MFDHARSRSAVTDVPLAAFPQPALVLRSRGADLVLVDANQAADDLTGLDGVADLAGRAIRDILNIELAHLLHATRPLPGGSARADYTPSQDTRNRFWRLSLSRLDDGAGTAILLVTATEFDADALLRARNAEIERLKTVNRDLTAFAGLVAHDMRGPLATVKMATQLTLNGFQDLGDGKIDTIRMCQRVAEKCLTAIDDVMAQVSARDVTDRSDVNFDAAMVCREIAEIVDPGGRLGISVPHARLRSDKGVFQSVVRNLLDNAARYARGRIDIGVGIAAGADQIELRVVDDGPGLPDGFDLAAHLDPNAPRDRSCGGYGLLAISRLLASQGGTIACTSGPDGTTFSVVMPGCLLTDTRNRGAATAGSLRRGQPIRSDA